MNDQDWFDKADRLLAHLDYTTQMAEQKEAHQEQLRALLLSMVDVMDAFDRFFGSLDTTETPSVAAADRWLPTVRLIARQLERALQEADVVPISCLGEHAEPDRHRIVGVREVPEHEEDTIMEEVFRGYKWGETVLRKPQVIVAHGKLSTT